MSRALLTDAAERIGWTAVQAFAAAVIAAGAFDLASLKVAAVAAGLAALKALVATRVGDRDTAATLPAGAAATGPGRRRASAT